MKWSYEIFKENLKYEISKAANIFENESNHLYCN